MSKKLKNRLIWTSVALLLMLAAAMVLSYIVSRPQFEGTLDEAELLTSNIAAPADALSFARYRDQGGLRVLLVTSYANDRLTGIDLSRRLGRAVTDPIELFNELGYDALAEIASQPANSTSVPASLLGLPFDGHADNIGIGANYREHARESGIDEEPFVFPKIAALTPYNSNVAHAGAQLLDYEVELGLVALGEITPDSPPQTMGLVLCNELTDRGLLVRNISPKGEMGTTGFVEGKSREGFAVIGSLLVIPRDLPGYYAQLEIQLYLNGELRQNEVASNMVWPPLQILSEIFHRKDWRFANYQGSTPLLSPTGSIRARTVIFSGTPAGVIFKPANFWNPWVYLQPGDDLVLTGSGLGYIRNHIVE